jgi:hypothetical protein
MTTTEVCVVYLLTKFGYSSIVTHFTVLVRHSIGNGPGSFRLFQFTVGIKGCMPFIKHPNKELPYILESNPHPFYSFRGLKNQVRD